MIVHRFLQSGLWKTEERQLANRLRAEVSPDIAAIRIELRLMMEVGKPSPERKLRGLVEHPFEPGSLWKKSRFTGKVFQVGPRMAWETDDSANTAAIFRACGMGVSRIEEFRRVEVQMQPGTRLTPEQKEKVYGMLHDRMTEQPYLQAPRGFMVNRKPEPVQLIDVLGGGRDALIAACEELGLALDETLVQYFLDYYRRLGRNPTDVELFDFGQLDSDHCRHHRFKGVNVVDGKQRQSLLEMIQNTLKDRSGVLVAFTDNAAALDWRRFGWFSPTNPTVQSPYAYRLDSYSFVFKVETHNHPTGVSPKEGAATGLAVRRDVFGTGRGAIPLVHGAVYCVGSLLIPGHIRPWEDEFPRAPQLVTPLKIIIGASEGVRENGNCFGNPTIMGSFRAWSGWVGDIPIGWVKPVMACLSAGFTRTSNLAKEAQTKGMLLVQLGGPGLPIGVGGGSGSSKVAGSQSATLDFNSVQRDNPIMERGNHEVIAACVALGPDNPIATITDCGGGGLDVAVAELGNPAGVEVDLQQIPSGDRTMSSRVLWCNEAQERMVAAVWPSRLDTLIAICNRNGCPMAVIGKITGEGKLVVFDSRNGGSREQQVPVDVDMDFLLGSLPQRTYECRRVPYKLTPFRLPDGMTLAAAIHLVLRLPAVGSKEFLTRKKDKSVTGLVAQQQDVGPLQLPLADFATLAAGYRTLLGQALSLGEQPIIGLVDAAAGARMSLAEALSNLALIAIKGKVSLSATWQWPCGQPGEDARLFDAVSALKQLCRKLGPRVVVGKDSVSMAAKCIKDGQNVTVRSPGTVQIFATATCPDITKKVTPDIKRPGESFLLLLEPGKKHRLGGSSLAQVTRQLGTEAPDVDNPRKLLDCFEAVQELVCEGLVLAGHDRSDGGLLTTVLEMLFAGDCGAFINLPAKDVFPLLFAEETGWVLEFLPGQWGEMEKVLKKHGVAGCAQTVGRTKKEKVIRIHNSDGCVFEENVPELRRVWQETSCLLDKMQRNPECVEEEHLTAGRLPPFNLAGIRLQAPAIHTKERPPVAVLRAPGTNGHMELAAMAYAAGFRPWDVVMEDLLTGRVDLDGFRGLLLPGGFSYKDRLGAGRGLARVVEYNTLLREMFSRFLGREDTFAFGVCNGCQVLSQMDGLWEGIPRDQQPRFVQNTSGMFESRFVAVRILPSDSIFLQGMEEAVLGIPVAHGEGRCYFPDLDVRRAILQKGMAPIRYVNGEGKVTEGYPSNPNGSDHGIAALCPNERVLMMMPHPERAFLPWQWPYWPAEWKHLLSPWLQMFQNVYQWCTR